MSRPKLRKAERFEQTRDGEALLVLRDPLGISEPFALDSEFAPVLDLLDGSRTVAQVRQSLLLRGQLNLPAEDLVAFVATLSDAGWLDDERFSARWERTRDDFLETNPRRATLAGTLYPADPPTLRAMLRTTLPHDPERTSASSSVLGVVAPHAPVESAGRVLDTTLRDLPEAAGLEAIVILGTDHGPGLLPYAITHRRYATPLGPVPTATTITEALERRVPWTLREEIRHRHGLSIELAVLVLQAVYGEQCPPIVPVLCGATVLSDPAQAHHVDAFVSSLEALVDDRRVLLWASAELSHAGAAYGRPALTHSVAAEVAERDAACLDALRDGRTQALMQHCAEPHPQGRPSGGAALTTLARLLPIGYRAELTGYETHSAPAGPSTGLVGLAGMRMYAPGP